MKRMILSIAALAAVGIASQAGAVPVKAPKPKLSLAQARVIALKLAPGRIKDSEYEYEKGGWRYSFDIVQGKRIHEIGVDGMTGRIVENVFEALGSKD